ncbi:MAG TPA: DUF1588 domain-containing protein [Polyangia bacterium]|jgi:hypothetical protein
MNFFAIRFWLLAAALATVSCGPNGGGAKTGTDAGGGGADASGSGGADALGAGGTDAAAAPADGSGGAGGVSGAGGASGTGGALPASRCSFNSGGDGAAAGTPATEMVVLGRLARFLDDASSAPAGVTASATALATAAFATAAATTILDDHVAKGTEAAGLVRFLLTWLKLPMNNAAPAHTWSRTLLAPNATLNTLFTAPTGDTHRSGVFTDRVLLSVRTAISSRGRWLAENVFCAPPFGDVTQIHLEIPADTTPGITGRQRLTKELALLPACAACHNQFDPPGFALEHFDEMGAYRDQDSSLPVDSAGMVLPPLPALNFTSIDDLAPQMAMSCAVAYCFANELLTDAFGGAAPAMAMPVAPAFSRSEADQVATAFVNANLSVRALVAAIVATPSFLRGP